MFNFIYQQICQLLKSLKKITAATFHLIWLRIAGVPILRANSESMKKYRQQLSLSKPLCEQEDWMDMKALAASFLAIPPLFLSFLSAPSYPFALKCLPSIL